MPFYKLSNGYKVAYNAELRGAELLLFVHGLGASKETFLESFKNESLRDFSILALDLLGFGESDKPENFPYTMESQADVVEELLSNFEFKNVHMVAHSMGNAVSVPLCERVKEIKSLINAEGNLIKDDCFFSMKVKNTPFKDFERFGFQSYKDAIKKIIEKGIHKESFERYLRQLNQTDARIVHRTSTALVDFCGKGLLQRFLRLQQEKFYFLGEENIRKFRVEDILRREGIEIIVISKSGHCMMTDNPSEFYEQVRVCVRRVKGE